MLEKQRDGRRQRHLETLKECERFVEQFYDNFSEKKVEIKETIEIFLSASDHGNVSILPKSEIEEIMSTLNDAQLLANDINFVNAAWEKVNAHRAARREEL